MLRKILNNKGFTLIEILVAMTVLTIVLAISTLILSSSRTVYSGIEEDSSYQRMASNIIQTIRSEITNTEKLEILKIKNKSDLYTDEINQEGFGYILVDENMSIESLISNKPASSDYKSNVLCNPDMLRGNKPVIKFDFGSNNLKIDFYIFDKNEKFPLTSTEYIFEQSSEIVLQNLFGNISENQVKDDGENICIKYKLPE